MTPSPRCGGDQILVSLGSAGPDRRRANPVRTNPMEGEGSRNTGHRLIVHPVQMLSLSPQDRSRNTVVQCIRTHSPAAVSQLVLAITPSEFDAAKCLKTTLKQNIAVAWDWK